MRVNVYGEEITEETQLVERKAEHHDETFYGIRGFLVSPDVLDTDGTDDDDRSAITYYVRPGVEVVRLRRLLLNMLMQLEGVE